MAGNNLFLQIISALLWKNFKLLVSRKFSILHWIVPFFAIYLISILSPDEFKISRFHSKFDSPTPLSDQSREVALMPDTEFTNQMRFSSNPNYVHVLKNRTAFASFEKRRVYAAVEVLHADISKYEYEYKVMLPDKYPEVEALGLLQSNMGGSHASFEHGKIKENYTFMRYSTYSLLLTMTFLFACISATTQLVEEKANRIRESLKMMGVSETCWMLSWALYHSILALVQTIFIYFFVLIFPDFLFGVSLFPVLLLFFSFSLSLFGLAYMCSALFDRPKLCSVLMLIVICIAGVALFYLTYGSTVAVQTAASLFSPVGFALMIPTLLRQSYLARLKLDLNQPTLGDDIEWLGSVDIWTAVLLMLLDTLLYLFIGSYLHRVVSSKFGQRLPWNFFCKFFKSRSNSSDSRIEDLLPLGADPNRFEQAPESDDKKSGIRVRQLRKTFARGQVVAVDALDVDMFPGEVFALLGPNGAGKTTLIDMLTGLYTPDRGQVFINGFDISTQLGEIRNSIGLCPQQNILFDNLTVKEHLAFYARLKGTNMQQGATASELLSSLGLKEKVNDKAKDLSGGQKRKLSVATAFIGASRVIILDEPTSGMDVEASRLLWNTIKKFKAGRVILLTTHELSEATLANRIGIMSDGKMQCSGSPLFLTRSYGVGYTLTVSRQLHSSEQQRASLHELVVSNVEGASLLSEAGAETMFSLPFRSTKQFPAFFRLLESAAGRCGVVDYGVTSTTLESVFLEVVRDSEQARAEAAAAMAIKIEDGGGQAGGDGGTTLVEPEEQSDRTGAAGAPFWMQFLLLCNLRFWHVIRSTSIWTMFLLVPFLSAASFKIERFYNNGPSSTTSVLPKEPTPLTVESFYGSAHDIVFKAVLPTQRPEQQPEQQPEQRPEQWPPQWSPQWSQQRPEQWLQQWPQQRPQQRPQQQSQQKLLFNDIKQLAAPSQLLPLRAESLSDLPLKLFVAKLKQPRLRFAFSGSTFYTFGDKSVLPVYINALLHEHASKRGGFVKGIFESTWSIENRSPDRPTDNNPRSPKFHDAEGRFYMFVLFLILLPCVIASDNIRIRTSKVQLQLLLSGANLYIYWFVSLLFGVLLLLIPAGACAFLLHYIYVLPSEFLSPFILLVVGFCLSSAPFVYLITLGFSSDSKTVFVFLVFFVSGPILFMANYWISVKKFALLLPSFFPAFDLFPAFAAMKGFGFLQNSFYADERNRFPIDLASLARNAKELEIISRHRLLVTASKTSTIFMFVSAAVFTLLIILIETIRFSPKLCLMLRKLLPFSTQAAPAAVSGLDFDVIAEQDRVLSDENLVAVSSLSKVYGNNLTAAVNQLSFGVSAGECYGLLGTNGSGKSSTLKMLIGEVLPSAGSVSPVAVDVLDCANLPVNVGYCAQFDSLIDGMSGRAHLQLFGRMMGIPSVELRRQIDYFIQQTGLNRFADRPAGTYSGGNKRKLSAALSLLGKRPVVLMDEPSSGIDPVSRRQLWDVIQKQSSSPTQCVVLTTQSMDESEALCSRISIMVDGVMQCIGSAHHLKQKFGNSFQLSLNAKSLASVQSVKAFVAAEVSQAYLLEQYETHLVFSMPKAHNSLADLFELLEEHPGAQGIEDFQIQETTLEQVFLSMARKGRMMPSLEVASPPPAYAEV